MDKIFIQIEGDDYWLEGGEFDEMLEVVKRIPGRRYNAEERVWLLPLQPHQVAHAVSPFRLMFKDEDELADSTPTRISP